MSLALVQAGVGSALYIGVEQPVDDEERSNEEGAFDPSDFAESDGQFVLAGIGCELSQQLAGRKGAADQGGSNPQDVRPSSSPLSVDPGRCDIVGKGRVRRTAPSVAPTTARPAPAASYMNGTVTIAQAGPYPYTSPMAATLIGYARCSTDPPGPFQMLLPSPISFRDEARDWPSARRSTTRTIPWERCSSVFSSPSPSSRPISSACSPARVWPSARARGKLRGKQPKLYDRQQRGVCRTHATGEYSISEIADLFSVSRPTVYRTLNRCHFP